MKKNIMWMDFVKIFAKSTLKYKFSLLKRKLKAFGILTFSQDKRTVLRTNITTTKREQTKTTSTNNNIFYIINIRHENISLPLIFTGN